MYETTYQTSTGPAFERVTLGDGCSYTVRKGERLTAAVAYRRLEEARYPVAKPVAGWGSAYALWMDRQSGLVDHPMTARQTILAAMKFGLDTV